MEERRARAAPAPARGGPPGAAGRGGGALGAAPGGMPRGPPPPQMKGAQMFDMPQQMLDAQRALNIKQSNFEELEQTSEY